MTLSMTMALLGGLALFLYGMKLMGEGLEKAAGDRLKRLLEALTRNPLMGLLVGVVFTMIIQSSSATTVMSWALSTPVYSTLCRQPALF